MFDSYETRDLTALLASRPLLGNSDLHALSKPKGRWPSSDDKLLEVIKYEVADSPCDGGCKLKIMPGQVAPDPDATRSLVRYISALESQTLSAPNSTE
jgi:hypothetical protein